MKPNSMLGTNEDTGSEYVNKTAILLHVAMSPNSNGLEDTGQVHLDFQPLLDCHTDIDAT